MGNLHGFLVLRRLRAKCLAFVQIGDDRTRKPKPIVDTLPASIEELTLVGKTYMPNLWKYVSVRDTGSYGKVSAEDMASLLDGLVERKEKHFPRLRRIIFEDCYDRSCARSSSYQQIRTNCEKAGIILLGL